jgi:hypothetical protein
VSSGPDEKFYLWMRKIIFSFSQDKHVFEALEGLLSQGRAVWIATRMENFSTTQAINETNGLDLVENSPGSRCQTATVGQRRNRRSSSLWASTKLRRCWSVNSFHLALKLSNSISALGLILCRAAATVL